MNVSFPIRVPHGPALLCGVAVVCALAGCGDGPQAEFGWRPSTTDLIRDAEKSVQQVMTENFGTPHDLVGWERMPVDYGGARAEVTQVDGKGPLSFAFSDSKSAARLQPGQSVLWLTGERAGQSTPAVLETFNPKTAQFSIAGGAAATGDKLHIGFGSQLQLGRVVYMKNCLHCHGVSGDGNGPTALYLNPRPRDYRLGIFKFTSTLSAERATRDDLHRLIKYGIPGTYMPSFLLMKDHENAAVVEYIRWLAMRGEMEKRLGDELADYNEAALKSEIKKATDNYNTAIKAGEKPEKPISLGDALQQASQGFATYRKEEFPGIIDETADFLADVWTRAEDEATLVTPKLARVPDSAESRLRGRVLYMSNRTKCYTCHGPHGRGDGAATEDFWPKPGTNEKYDKRGLHDLWGNPLPPRDLTKGQYRGGRRPLDLYRRVFAGIKGTPMPAFGGTVLKDEEIWDLVNYVMNIPFESSTTGAVRPATMAHTPAPPEGGH